jgi:hypothetical protein
MLDYAILGTPRKHPDKCSKCDAEIPDEAVPLMLFADGRNLMWCYCERCEESMFMILKPREAPAIKSATVQPTTGVETHGKENQN